MSQPHNAHYFSDLPVQLVDDDKFDRKTFATRIAKTIATRTDTSNLVIGIYGAWGEGKTSVLHFIEQVLAQDKEVIATFWFNPWQFSSDPYELLENFILTLAQQLNLSIRDELKEKLSKWVKNYGSLAAALFGKADVAEKAASMLNPDLNLAELKGELERILTEANKYVIVFMDDIDRLDRREIQLLFKMIKLSVDFRRIVYVLAFDDEMVAAALGEQYGQGNLKAGRDFLEKIVQVPLQLPIAERSSLKLFFYEQLSLILENLHLKLTNIQERVLWEEISRGIEPRLKTPRMIHRYCNALRFAIPILLGEVNLVDQVLIEGIRVCYPNLYNMIRSDPDVFLQYNSKHMLGFQQYDIGGNHSKSVYNKIIEGLMLEEIEAVNHLLGFLFPAFARRIIDRYAAKERNPDKEQKISSRYYFHRYFSYAVTTADIADAKVHNFFENLLLKRQQEVDALLNTLSPAIADTFLRKIEVRIPEIALNTAGDVAIALSKAGQIFSASQNRSAFRTIRFEALKLIYLLVKRVDPIQRHEVIQKIIKLSSPIAFSVEIAQWLLSRENREEPLLQDEEFAALQKYTSDWLSSYFSSYELSNYDGDLQQLFTLWSRWGGRIATNHCIKTQLAHTERYVLMLLHDFYEEAWRDNLGSPISLGSAHKSYERLVSVVDEDVIYRAIQKLEEDTDFKPILMQDPGYLQPFPEEHQDQHNAKLFNEEYASRRSPRV